MQQMVGRQVDLGTYAGQSFLIGHDRGGLVAIALIEYVGKTAQVVTRKDLNITSVADLKGKKVANQVGSSVGNVFVDTIGPKYGVRKARLPGNPDERQRHGRRHGGQDRRRHGQCRALQRDRRRRRDRHFDPRLLRLRPHAGADGGDARIRRQASRHRGRLSQGLAGGRGRLQEQPGQGGGRDLFVLHRQGLQDGARTPSRRRWRASR